MTFPLKNPEPDFEKFTDILKGKRKPERVHFVEIGIDQEVSQFIIENLFGEKWIPFTEETKKEHLKQIVNFYYRMVSLFVKIDAFHSFQDVIIPVGEFLKRYGDKIAALGGIDMDKLSRMDEDSLRKYVRETIDECMEIGRYALGSGNTIANYIPVKNYLTMLDEGLKWKRQK